MKNTLRKIGGFIRGKVALVATLAVVGVSTVANAQSSTPLVAYDETTGVTFSPAGLVTPVITGVVAAIIACVSLVILWNGAKWMYRVFKGSK